LPWNHTFGGNFNLNFVLANGGTLYVDEGRPAPGRFEATIRNLKAVSPTVYLNVPRGFDLIVPAMEADAALRNAVFRDLDMLFFAGAAMPPNLRLRLEKLSVAARGLRVPVITSLGSTETAPSATMMCWDSDVSGDIGLPLPGCIAKLVPNGDKLEVRFKGPHITPGYYRAPHLTADAFDEEGYFRIGDAARLVDPADPAKGLVFDGRVAENFKLMTGTWVHAGMLRISAIDAAAPAIQDAVVTGHDREEVGLLAFPSLAGCRTLCGAPETATLADLICRPEVRARVAEGLARHNARNPGSSTRIARALLMAEPPAIDANEITDKGYINQRAVLARRAALVERLYAVKPGPDVVLAPPGPR
jgi:feruloyl-CoA synthase